MEKETPQPDQQPQKIVQVFTPNEVRPGHFSNMTNSNVLGTEVVIDFMMTHPNDNPSAIVVSRVIMSRDHAHEFAIKLRQAIEEANEVRPPQ